MAAMENPRIRAYMVDANEFPDAFEVYGTTSVPLTVVDSKQSINFLGRYPERMFVAELLKAVQ